MSLNICVRLATVFKLSDTKVLYLVKLLGWRRHQMVELRVPLEDEERDSSHNIDLLTVQPPDMADNLRGFY